MASLCGPILALFPRCWLSAHPLAKLFGDIAPMIGKLPVLLTQHMPPTFTTILAQHMSKVTRAEALEAIDGEAVVAGRVYVAPGAKHMRLARKAGQVSIALDDGPPINYCKPAVDPLFQSASEIFGPATLGVVLTGMGSDGARGAVSIADAGGSVIAQDEASCVVWGMPQAAAQAGACAAVLPLNDIGRTVSRIVQGGRP